MMLLAGWEVRVGVRSLSGWALSGSSRRLFWGPNSIIF